jgi:uncharacterized protein
MLEVLEVHITNECNLNCPYCFNLKRSGDFLSAREILKSINDLFEEQENNYFLHFIGGEPLLRWEEIKDVIRTIWLKNGFLPNHSITTNGKNLTKKIISEFEILKTKVTLSIEGKKERHLALRTPWSEDEYEELIANTKQLIKKVGPENLIARMTLFDELWNVVDDIDFLYKLGIKRIKILPDLKINPKNSTNAINMIHTRFKQMILNRKISIFPVDQQLLPNFASGCGVGEEMICLAPDKNYYPCHRFVYHKDLILGNLTDGINNNSFIKWSKGMSKLKSICETCTHCRICNFPCAYPDVTSINSNWCNWMKGIN